MKFFEKKSIKLIALTAVFIFTFILRAHNYDRDPSLGQLEELAFAWAGINLIYDKVPMSWSTLEYPKSAQVYKGEMNLDGNEPRVHITLYSPWLDQPPLYSLISGGSAYIFGAVRWDILPAAFIRLPQIFLSFLISVFIFLIAKKVSGFWMAFTAVFIYGSAPMFVLSSRLAVPENLLGLIYMILIYGILSLREKTSVLLIASLPVLVGLGGLAKATGFLVAPLLICELFQKKYYKSIAYSIVVIAVFVGLFISYGLYFDAGIFWRLIEIQSGRPVGFGSLGYILATPAYDIFMFYDTFYIFCLFSFVYFIFSTKPGDFDKSIQNRNFLILAGVYWLIVVMMSGGERDLLSWYRFGLFPLLPIFGAWGLKEAVENISFVKSVFAISLFLGNRFLLVNPFRPNLEPGLFRTIFSLLVIPSLGYEAFRKKYLGILTKAIVVGVFLVGSYLNIIYVYNAHEIKCESVECPIGPSTFLSRMHFPFIWRFFTLGLPTNK